MFLFVYIGLLALALVLHELGHYGMAKVFGVPVEGFAVGFGPLVWHKKIAGTDWKLKLMPLGGANEIEEEALMSLSAWKRICVFAAGPGVNLILAFVSMVVVFALRDNFSILAVIGKFFGNLQFLVTGIVPSLFAGMQTSHSNLSDMSAVATASFAGATGMRAALIGAFNLFYASNFILAIGNLFPIPALDGGQIVLTVPELFGKRISPHITCCINRICLTGILCITGFTLVKDILLFIK